MFVFVFSPRSTRSLTEFSFCCRPDDNFQLIIVLQRYHICIAVVKCLADFFSALRNILLAPVCVRIFVLLKLITLITLITLMTVGSLCLWILGNAKAGFHQNPFCSSREHPPAFACAFGP